MNPRLPAIAALLLSLLCAPARAAPAASESFTFRLRLGFLPAGRARLALTPAAAGAPRLLIVGEAEAVGVARILTRMHDEYQVIADRDTLLPLDIRVRESGYRERLVATELHGPRAAITTTWPTPPARTQRASADVAAVIYDPVTAYLALRRAALRPGEQVALLVLDGSALYRGTFSVAGRERLRTPLGERAAIRLRCLGTRLDLRGRPSGAEGPRQGTLWLSDDPQRLLLRVDGATDIGMAHFELTSHSDPQATTAR